MDDYKNIARRIMRANSKLALDKAVKVADKLCSLGFMEDCELDRINDLFAKRFSELLPTNPGLGKPQ